MFCTKKQTVFAICPLTGLSDVSIAGICNRIVIVITGVAAGRADACAADPHVLQRLRRLRPPLLHNVRTRVLLAVPFLLIMHDRIFQSDVILPESAVANEAQIKPFCRVGVIIEPVFTPVCCFLAFMIFDCFS